MTKLFEFGGFADVLIKVKSSELVLNGKTYTKNEPFTILRNVSILLNYEENTKQAVGKTTILDFIDGRPNNIQVNNIALNDKVCALISTKVDKQINRTYNEQIISSNNKLYTNYDIVSDIFIYDTNLNKVEYESFSGNTIVGNFEDKLYYVYYAAQVTGTSYSLEIPSLPYFSLEIYGKGNKDKHTSDVFMKFDTVHIATTPLLNFTDDDILNTPLIFNIIYNSKEDQPIIVFGR